MRRRIITAVAAIAILAVAGGTVAASERRDGGRLFTVVERAETDIVIDLGAPGDSLGDQLPFGNPIFDKTNTTQVGRDEGYCVRTNPGLSWECTWTTILDHGTLTVQGPFYDDGRDSKLAITGGTGIYRNARGQMTLHFRNPAGTEFDFIFRVIGG
jgi:allene oxide cyclase